MPKINKDEKGVTAGDLDAARRFIGIINSTSRDPMVYFDKVKKANIVAALVATSWYLDLLPDMGANYLAAAANMAKSDKIKDLGAVASAVKGADKATLIKYMDGPLIGDESVYTSSQWRVPIKGRDAAYSAPDVSVINGPPSGSGSLGSTDAVVGAGVGVDSSSSSSSSSGLAPPGGQIPSAQGDPSSSSSSPGDPGGDDGSNNGSTDSDDDGKVSDHRSASATSLAAPIQLTNGPNSRTDLDDVGDGLVDIGTNGTGVARDDGVGVQGEHDDVGSGKNKNNTTSSGWKPRVCSRVWKGKVCKLKGCKYAHPTPCNNENCVSANSTANGCKAFHLSPRWAAAVRADKGWGNGTGGAQGGAAAPNRNKNGPNSASGGGSGTARKREKSFPNGNNKGRGSGSNGSNNRGGSGSRSSSSRSSGNSNENSKLHVRVAAMERRLQLGEEKRKVSYRDALMGGGNSSNSGNVPRVSVHHGGSDRAQASQQQLSPAVLSTVVAAVLAVLAERPQQYNF